MTFSFMLYIMLFYREVSSRLLVVSMGSMGVAVLTSMSDKMTFVSECSMQSVFFMCVVMTTSSVPTMSARTFMGRPGLFVVSIVVCSATVRFETLFGVRLPGLTK